MRYKKSLLGYTYIILASVIYGLMPLGANLIYAEGVTPYSLVFIRNLLAVPFLAILVKLGGASFKVPLRSVAKMTSIGILGNCLTPLLLYISYGYLSGGATTVLHHIYPAVVVLGGILFMKKKTNYKQILCLTLCMLGILFMYDPAEKLNLTGAVIALLSGVVYAAYILLLSAFPDKNVSGALFNFYAGSAISVIMFAVCLVSNKLALPHTLSGWGICLLFSFATSIGAVILFQKGTFLIGGSRSSILSNIETVTSVAAGFLFLREKVTPNTVVSMTLIIAASVLIAIFDGKKQKNEVQ